MDTGLTDSTIDKIERWIEESRAHGFVKLIKVGSKFHDSDGDFHFGNAKTFAFENATKDFVMWLDASDIVTDPVAVKKEFIYPEWKPWPRVLL